MRWLRTCRWHYCLRLPCDVLLQGAKRYPTTVATLYPPIGEARLYRHVGLWQDGIHRCNLVLATVKGLQKGYPLLSSRQTDHSRCATTISHTAGQQWIVFRSGLKNPGR